MNRVVITGMGIVSPIGNTPAAVKAALVEGKSGIQAMPDWAQYSGLRSLIAGPVEGLEPRDIPRAWRRTMGRVSLLAAFAARDAVGDSRLDAAAIGSDRTGVAMGSTTGSAAALERFFGDFCVRRSITGQEGTTFMKVASHTVMANVAAMLGVKGRGLAPCTACASSAQAIGDGFEIIRHGLQDIMICGGAEELHMTTAAVFDVVSAASRRYNDTPHLSPRPFDRGRDGLVVGEGAAAVVLEEYRHAVGRGAPIYGEVRGYATCCDAYHITQPSSDGMRRCMQEAARSAGLAPTDLDYLNAHATGTEMGDAAEAEALRAFVGDAVPVSGTKGYTGHTLAACGAMEVIFCLLMMRDGFVAPTLNLTDVAPECGGLRHVQQLVHCSPRLIMTSNFAFGGVNASLVLAKA